MVLRPDLAWHRRPRLSEAVLAVVRITALCLFTAGAVFYVARTGGMPGLAWLLVCTLPLKVLALTIGTHRRRLTAVLDVRQIACLRAVLTPAQWLTVGREAEEARDTVVGYASPASLRDVLYWLDAGKHAGDYTRQRVIMDAQIEAFRH